MTDDNAAAGAAACRIDERLDCTGLRCPLPLLRTKQLLHRLPAGAVLEVTATDAGAQRDIPAWLALTPHRLLESSEAGGQFRFLVCRGSDPVP